MPANQPVSYDYTTDTITRPTNALIHTGFTAKASALYDAVKIFGRAGGSSGYIATFTTTTLTASRTHTFPDNSGTIAELNYPQTWTADQTVNAIVYGNSFVTNSASLEVNDVASVALVSNNLSLSGINANIITITGTSPLTTLSGLTVGAKYSLINGTGGNLTITHSASLFCKGAANLVLANTECSNLIPRSTTTGSFQ